MPAPSLTPAPHMQQSQQSMHVRPVFKPFYAPNNATINATFIDSVFAPQSTVMHHQTMHQTMQQTMQDYSPMCISPVDRSFNTPSMNQSVCSTASTLSNCSVNRSVKRPCHFTFSLDDIDQSFRDVDLEEWFDMSGQQTIETMDESDDTPSMQTMHQTMHHTVDSPVIVTMPKLSIVTGYSDAIDQSGEQTVKKPQHFTFSPTSLASSVQTVSQPLQLGHWSTYPLCQIPVISVQQLRVHLSLKRSIEQAVHSVNSVEIKQEDLPVNHSKFIHHTQSQQSTMVWSRSDSRPSMQPQHRLVRSVSAVPAYRRPPAASSDPSSMVNTPAQSQNQVKPAIFSPNSHRKRHHSQTLKPVNQSISHSISIAAAQYAAQQAAYEMSLYQQWQSIQNLPQHQHMQPNQHVKTFDQFTTQTHNNFQDVWTNARPHNQSMQQPAKQPRWTYQSTPYQTKAALNTQLPCAESLYTKHHPRVISAPYH